MGKTRASKRRRKNEEEDKEKHEEEKNTKSLAAAKINKSPLVVFAHGAGAPSTSDWMLRWKELLAKALSAVEVVTFDYPYISGGKKRAPPKAEKLIDFHSDIIRKAVAKYPDHPLILIGKSMGSRVSCMVAGGEHILASAVICLGYPLKILSPVQILFFNPVLHQYSPVIDDQCRRPRLKEHLSQSLYRFPIDWDKARLKEEGMKGAIRDDTLLQLKVPIMFVQGSKDVLCPLDKLEAVRKKMTFVNELYVIEGGDHSFKISKKHLQLEGSSQEEAEECAANAISKFISRLMEGR